MNCHYLTADLGLHCFPRIRRIAALTVLALAVVLLCAHAAAASEPASVSPAVRADSARAATGSPGAPGPHGGEQLDSVAICIVLRLRHMLEAASLFATPTLFDSRIYSYGSSHRATGTEASCYQAYMDALAPGPGNIEQAHTAGEWVEFKQLQEAVEVYTRLIEDSCG